METTDIEYHRNILHQSVSKLKELHSVFQAISHNILGGYTYITSDIEFKLDNATKDKQTLLIQYNILKKNLNSYVQLISLMISELQRNQSIGTSLLNTLTKQIRQINDPSFIDDTTFQIDLSNLGNNISNIELTPDITQTLFEDDKPISLTSHQNIISLHNKVDEPETFTKIVDTTQEEDKTNIFTEDIIDDIVVEKNKLDEITDENKSKEKITELADKKYDDKTEELTKDTPTDDLQVLSTDTSKVSIDKTTEELDTTKKRNILLEEHPDEVIKFNYNIHDGPQLTDIIINNDEIVWNGGREKFFINHILNQLENNPFFSAHDIYHLLCANLLPNYVNIIYLYDKYIQNYEIHLADIKDQNIIKIGFKSVIIAYSANDKIFNEDKINKILEEWNDSFHELKVYN